jgi:hypothetical protein
MTINFTVFFGCLFPGVPDNSVKADVHGIIQGLPVPWPLHDPDACHSSGLTCPLQPGNNYHYTSNIEVLKSYPKVSSSLQTKYVFMPYQIVADVWKTWRRYSISESQNSVILRSMFHLQFIRLSSCTSSNVDLFADMICDILICEKPKTIMYLIAEENI